MINPKIIIGSEVLVAQVCPTLFDLWSVHGILQAGILKGVAIPFWSSRPRDPTWVSYIAGRFFTIWATRAARPIYIYILECQRAHFPSANDLMHKLLHGPKCWLFQHFMKVASIWTLLNWLFVQVELNLLKSKSVLQLESPVWLSKSEFWGIAKFPGNLSGAFSRWLVADVYFSKWNKFTNYISNQILQPS